MRMLSCTLCLTYLRICITMSFGYAMSPHFPVNQTFGFSSVGLDNQSTSAPTPSCTVQKQDPDRGIYAVYCVCDEIISLPLITPTPPTANISASCESVSFSESVIADPTPDTDLSSLSTGDNSQTPRPTPGDGFSSLKHGVLINYISTRRIEESIRSMYYRPTGSEKIPHVNNTITLSPIHSLNQSSKTNHRTATCPLEEAYCSLSGYTHALDRLRNVCMLWDSNCTGDRKAAMRAMPVKMNGLYRNQCFKELVNDCTERNPPGRVSELAKLKSWMRSPQCHSSSAEYKVMQGYASDLQHLGHPWNSPYFQCCWDCSLEVYNADVYY